MPQKLILIVEDEPENAEIIRAVVEDILGHEAMLADNGQMALEMAQERRPDLVLMDLMMPVMNGFVATQQLKATPRTAAVPVIALTALSRPRDHQMALETGANDYVSKPFDLDLLADTIQTHLTPISERSDEDESPIPVRDEYDIT